MVNIAHHVTQRGNAPQFILADDDERVVHVNLLRHYVELCELSLLGYCLTSNHVHLLVVRRKGDALAKAFKQTHGRYASREVCLVLERQASVERTRLAGAISIVRVGRESFVGGLALRGIESCAGGAGNSGRIVAVVQRGGALR